MKNKNRDWTTLTYVSAFLIGGILFWSIGKNWLNLESMSVFLVRVALACRSAVLVVPRNVCYFEYPSQSLKSLLTFVISHLAHKSSRYPALGTKELPDYHWAIRTRRLNMFSRVRTLLFLTIIVVLFSTTISACSTSKSSDAHLNMTSMEQMPAEVQSAPGTVQAAYQFASANPES